MKTILVPTDFSEQATNATKLAAEMARHSKARIVLLNVIEGTRSFAFNTMGEASEPVGEEAFFINKLIEIQKKHLKEAAAQEALKGLTVETVLEMGSPYESISNLIADYKADLLIMGTKGSSGLDEILIGSNTEKVVRYAKCPVITVKNEVSLKDIKNIVYATNLSTDQSAFIPHIKTVQSFTGARLHLLKVNTPNHFYTQRQLNKEFARFKEQHGLLNCTTNIYNEVTEEDGILYFAEDLGECMVAIATHGRTGLLHLLTGSIAEDLVNHATIPVMTLSMKK
ncbi:MULTISPECIES: universal stress protein [Roseivirga]|jgi:nucleotide-binding universal stress UspA family protein|uniref:universal stress protein n=1 Tax=Roseivirga TaxID=290180 RepID=UPI00257F804C|nr:MULTISPECIES: universal stress protein [Roseivirga]MEC7754898.1 universal stress protein [Bacteroidota bacterium]|tara:strand:+ start:19937 stop:20785 length:849 start_codon:yes stop_codon:yes gene_type:complete